jgi:mycothiol synthase
MSPLVKLLDSSQPQTAQLCNQVFTAALDAEKRDDRLVSGVGSVCAVAFEADNPIGYCMGTPSDTGRLALDLVIVDGMESVAFELWTTATDAAVASLPELWGRPAMAYHDSLADQLDLSKTRELFQMRAPLPIDAEPIASQPFRPGTDDAAWISVNNASFNGHPDQGTYTQADLSDRMAQPWFDPDGFRLFFDGEQLAGFCWTKIHRRSPLEDLGEIYVIGLAPSHHGQGLGVPMTAAGLSWLAGQGLDTAMLYVEANNAPAVATYGRLGFSVFATYKAWGKQ